MPDPTNRGGSGQELYRQIALKGRQAASKAAMPETAAEKKSDQEAVKAKAKRPGSGRRGNSSIDNF